MTVILGEKEHLILQQLLNNFGLTLEVGEFIRKDGSKTPLHVRVVDEDKLMLAASKAYVRRAIKPLI